MGSLFFLGACKNNATKEIKEEKEMWAVELVKKPTQSPTGSILQQSSYRYRDKNTLRGVPQLDTFVFQFFSRYRSKKITELYQNGIIDSVKFPRDSFKPGNWALSGYRNGKQVILVDTNNNFDFSDETPIEFDRELKKVVSHNPSARDSFPFLDITYSFFNGKKVTDRVMKIRPLPAEVYYTDNRKHTLEDSLQLKAETQEYLLGEMTIDGVDRKVAVSEFSLFGRKILLADENNRFPSRKSPDYRSNLYKVKDTFFLNNRYYRFDSIDPYFSKIYIRDLKMKSKEYGYKKGEKMRNYSFELMDGTETSIKALATSKKWVILDFWGTWCGPCKELTPDLIKMHSEYKDQIHLVSIAFDKTPEPVIDYIQKHKMDWHHHYIEGNAKSGKDSKGLVKALQVESYPTFILIDKDRNIRYRGSGKGALLAIEELMAGS